MLYRKVITAFLTIIPLIAFSQLPSSDVYLFKFQLDGDSLRVYDAKLLTHFNQGTYNNQPQFFSYGHLYLTSYNKNDEQTDIIHLDLERSRLIEVTNTPESEYSPTLVPGNKYLSCIRVFPEDDNAQLLWRYPVDQSKIGKALFPDLKNVGYHFWLNKEKVALFLVDEPHQFAIANTRTKSHRVILENIGRTFKRSKNGKLLFIHKISDTVFYIKEFDESLNKATIVTETMEGIEDFDVLEDGSLISGKGSKLYRFVPDHSTRWEKVADLKKYKITDIGRISSKFDRLSLVSRNP